MSYLLSDNGERKTTKPPTTDYGTTRQHDGESKEHGAKSQEQEIEPSERLGKRISQ
jgi:hypothetical protein